MIKIWHLPLLSFIVIVIIIINHFLIDAKRNSLFIYHNDDNLPAIQFFSICHCHQQNLNTKILNHHLWNNRIVGADDDDDMKKFTFAISASVLGSTAVVHFVHPSQSQRRTKYEFCIFGVPKDKVFHPVNADEAREHICSHCFSTLFASISSFLYSIAIVCSVVVCQCFCRWANKSCSTDLSAHAVRWQQYGRTKDRHTVWMFCGW